MLQSLLFVPTIRETPKEADVLSQQILVKGGYIKMNAAGVYSYLPLAFRIIKRIEQILREELDAIGCSELLMPALQIKELWLESGRWNDYGKELMRLKDRHDRDFCLGPTHEEVVTSIVRDTITSYKKLPLALYQIQTKFRDEFRPRYGLMRAREFIMKDLYTFHMDQADLDRWYLAVRQVYINCFRRMGLGFRIVSASSGQIGGKSSEEFIVLCDIGEDTIAYSDTSDFAINTELEDLPIGAPSPDGNGTIKHAKGIEVGHIFKLGTKYSETMNAAFIGPDQMKKPILMGCYGIGVSRLLMAIAEQHSTKTGVIWPKEVAPFAIHILPLGLQETNIYQQAQKLYQNLIEQQVEVLFDDRIERPGVKFSDADLIGVRFRVIFGQGLANNVVEVRDLASDCTEQINLDSVQEYLLSKLNA